jgi:hypothetical protein
MKELITAIIVFAAACAVFGILFPPAGEAMLEALYAGLTLLKSSPIIAGGKF